MIPPGLIKNKFALEGVRSSLRVPKVFKIFEGLTPVTRAKIF
jgi:hypothetical protein